MEGVPLGDVPLGDVPLGDVPLGDVETGLRPVSTKSKSTIFNLCNLFIRRDENDLNARINSDIPCFLFYYEPFRIIIIP